MTITRTARRLLAGALVASAAAAAAAPTGASAATSAPELTTQIETLVGERLNLLQDDFVPVNPNPGNVAPGKLVEAQIRDTVDPSGFLTQKNRRKINLADTGSASLVGLDISVKWTAHNENGNPLSPNRANAFGPTTLPFASFKFAPEIIQKGLPENILQRKLRATLQITADPPPVSKLVEPLEGQLDRLDVPIDLQGATQADIDLLKRVDVEAVERSIVVDIVIPVLPLPVPSRQLQAVRRHPLRDRRRLPARHRADRHRPRHGHHQTAEHGQHPARSGRPAEGTAGLAVRRPVRSAGHGQNAARHLAEQGQQPRPPA
jgi:hypothetical protein